MALDYQDSALVHLPMLMDNHDPVNNHTEDISGNNWHGVFAGGAATPTKITHRRGYSFDGGDYMIVGSAGSFPLASLTVLMALSYTNITSSMVFNYYLGTADAWGGIISGANIAIYDDIDNAGVVLYGTGVTDGSFYTHAFVMDGLENLQYNNGILVGSGTSSTANWDSFGGSLYIGARSPATSPMYANLYNFMLFDSALSNVEIADYHKLMLKEINKI